MRILITTLLLSAFSALNAQYHPFAVKGREWNQVGFSVWLGVSTINITVGDSIAFNGKMLPTLLMVDTLGNIRDTVAVIDEDPSVPEITFYQLYGNGTSQFTSVRLDMSLQIGDTGSGTCLAYPDSSFAYVLDSTSFFIDLAGISRKTYHYRMLYDIPYSFNWIEGLGNTVGSDELSVVFPQHCGVIQEGSLGISCIFDPELGQIYYNPYYADCQVFNFDEHNPSQLKVYPNPAHDMLRIDNTANITSVEILDMTGQIKKSWSFSGSDPVLEINLDGLTPGVYIVKSTRGTSVSVRKIIVQLTSLFTGLS